MRKITADQLAAELQVGTVDLSDVEIVGVQAPVAETTSPTKESDGPDASSSEGAAAATPSISFEDALKAQADKALETIPADTRAAAAVEVANGEEIEEAGPQG